MSGAGGKTSECGQRMDSCTRLQGGGQGEREQGGVKDRVPGVVQNRVPGGVEMNRMPGARPVNMSSNVKMRQKKQAVSKGRPGSEVREDYNGDGQRTVRPLSCIEGARQKEIYRSCRGDSVCVSIFWYLINICICISQFSFPYSILLWCPYACLRCLSQLSVILC